MTKNPFINAILAVLYIVIVASVMFFGMAHSPKTDTVIVPIAILCLFSLSAAIMGYLFLNQPLQLYFEGKKKEALDLFLKTVASFGALTLLAFGLMFSGIIK